MIEVLFVFSALCFLFGIVYPACAIIVYPFYVLFGGKKKFLDYMKNL